MLIISFQKRKAAISGGPTTHSSSQGGANGKIDNLYLFKTVARLGQSVKPMRYRQGH